MTSKRERRAAAFEAIANALLELATIERESEEIPSEEVLIDRRTCQKELGLPPGAFLSAAGREFPAFRVSKRVTATKADVLAWLKSRKVGPKQPRIRVPSKTVEAPGRFFEQVQARFEARVGRPMTDDELFEADLAIDVGRFAAAHHNRPFDETPDDVAASIASKIGQEHRRHGEWRSLGLDVAEMENRAEELRAKLRLERPEMSWSDRVDEVLQMWADITNPLKEARNAARKAARAAKETKKGPSGSPGPKR